jgi:3D-(3,5/4)-trihydroxycyclohexane-1,2-dione acylhydrolase (decyclizing)
LLEGPPLPVDLAANAASLGASVIRAQTRSEIERALEDARRADGVTAIVIPVDSEQRVGGYESWWDVPVAEVSSLEPVQRARQDYERARKAVRHYL